MWFFDPNLSVNVIDYGAARGAFATVPFHIGNSLMGLRGHVIRPTPLMQHALLTVEIGDVARARRRCHERRVVEPHAGQQLAPLGGVDPTVLDRDLDRLARPVVGDRH